MLKSLSHTHDATVDQPSTRRQGDPPESPGSARTEAPGTTRVRAAQPLGALWVLPSAPLSPRPPRLAGPAAGASLVCLYDGIWGRRGPFVPLVGLWSRRDPGHKHSLSPCVCGAELRAMLHQQPSLLACILDPGALPGSGRPRQAQAELAEGASGLAVSGGGARWLPRGWWTGLLGGGGGLSWAEKGIRPREGLCVWGGCTEPWGSWVGAAPGVWGCLGAMGGSQDRLG